MVAPVLSFSQDVEGALRLAKVTPAQRDELLAWFQSRLQPGFVGVSRRVSDRPLRVGLAGRLLGRKPSPPVLPATTSKFAGVPYLESPQDWPTDTGGLCPFLLQINFAELPVQVAPLPAAGILAVYVLNSVDDLGALAFRFYPAPDPAKAVAPPVGSASFAKWEARFSFEQNWFLPEDEGWRGIVGPASEDVWQELLDWQGRFEESRGAKGPIELLGYPSSWLLGSVGSNVLANRRVLVRVDQDPASGFSIGDNVLYALIGEHELNALRFDRAIGLIANV